MADGPSRDARVRVDGKFFCRGGERFLLRGVAYGPLAVNGDGEPWASPASTTQDLALIRELGANLVRVYVAPPRWFLDSAGEQGLQVWVDVPWNKEACFLDRPDAQRAARQAVQVAARECAAHPAVFALSVVNEIPADIVRWSGPEAVAEFLEGLIGLVKQVDPTCLCTFGNFPPTEYLQVREADFHCFNVYLDHPRAYRNYLARLHLLADTRPLVLGELGFDSRRWGREPQARRLADCLAVTFHSGAAGATVFSFTDEWFKDGRLVPDWEFGLTTRERERKPAYFAVQQVFASRAPLLAASGTLPLVSVVVAAYNAARTLRPCLESLGRLRYPRCELLLVDDGSTDETARIAADFPNVRLLRHERNLGLSVARNTGIAAASGQVVAFTDADCRVDEAWLDYLVRELTEGTWAGVGGPNLLPPDDSHVAAAVMASPGGPTHVMLTDRVAEHIPGCNMAFWKWALEEVGGFDPVFRQAGDDVDLCWRLQQSGLQLGFSPAGFVWHYRRSTVREYLRQQHGYGEAEARLERKHPEYFSPLGGSIWRGRIYTPHPMHLLTRRPMIYHGLFGASLFQSVYRVASSLPLPLASTFEYHLLVTLPLLVLAPLLPWLLPLGLVSLALSAGMCVVAAAQADVPRRHQRFWSRPLIALLFFLQPLVRGWARYHRRLFLRRRPLASRESLDTVSRANLAQRQVPEEVHYWAPPGFHRHAFLARTLERLEQQGWPSRTDTGWTDYDLEVYGSRWAKVQLTTVGEYTPDGHQVLRCRLRPALTLPSRAMYGLLLGVALLTLGWAGPSTRWAWLLLLLLPAWGAWLSQHQRDLQRILAVFLDDTAASLQLTRLEREPPV